MNEIVIFAILIVILLLLGFRKEKKCDCNVKPPTKPLNKKE